MKPTLTITPGEPDAEKGVQVVKFAGEFDKAGHMEIRGVLDDVVKVFKLENLIFDFTGLKFINSESIGYLMEIHNILDKKKKNLVLVGPDTHVKDVLKTIGIADVIPVHATLSAYLNAK
ncbi:STAS domain-containing protein [Candidatus Peregrinibacteria bacterium]|jgi:anti-anti-sigma factor|nr:STAS domain-containing protein [Candidatus Peregrinibacteria bacterium]MBT4055487.1 STAS domain-containing protein [Candidatus Peregrinibacteria bacterium]